MDDSEWNNQLEKQQQKCPSSIEILNARQCRELGIESSLPDGPETYAKDVSSFEIVAVVRPSTYKSGTPSKHLEQKYMMKDKFEMSLVIAYCPNKKLQDAKNIYSGRVEPTSLKDLHGLYVFKPRCKLHPLFQQVGIYIFTFSIVSNIEFLIINIYVGLFL
ncbi:hypothetical protein HanOQP8_Chr08g0287061 [Helianthus annuus]|nr:hypothetical protein HanLR1_Chr08g0279481 [Helianthus annuus]KAJ0722473.1 hypothetical protein HanOQP8_Chr08g0287061 [Helianthus annuus]